MTYEEAYEILKPDIREDGTIHGIGHMYVAHPGDWNDICLDGEIDLNTLEALVVYLKRFKSESQS